MASTQRSFRLVTAGGATVARDVTMADNPWSRFMGLMGKRELADGAGLYLRPCSSIHMFFMRFPLDIAFIDEDGRVVRLYHGLRPWRMSRIVRRAKAAIELRSGTLAHAGVTVGDLLTMS
ncbi:MAG: DUF192 domain-containing protein [Candidatus Dormiibacterota bacterium]